jgi:hypothetical protein
MNNKSATRIEILTITRDRFESVYVTLYASLSEKSTQEDFADMLFIRDRLDEAEAELATLIRKAEEREKLNPLRKFMK